MGQLGGLSPQGSVAVGILVGILSTSIQSIGLTLQRKSHLLEDEKESDDHRRPPFKRRRWQLGMLMFIVSNLVGSSIQITTLPLPVLSTLQASGLVFNSICATLILGEPFTRYSLSGTLLVAGGAVLIAIFGAIGEPAHNLDQLLVLLGRSQFILWMIGQAALVVAIIVGAKAMKLMNPWTSNSPRMRLFRGMAYGCISGILSAHSLLVAKSAVELLVRTIVDKQNQFNRWQSWVILLGLLALALSQLYYLHRGLKLCSTSVLYPFVFCVYNIIAILDGLIYFNQSSRLPVLHALLIALGTIILLAGVLALSWRLNDDPSTRPTLNQPPLTPGMGFADDSPTPTPTSTSPSSPTLSTITDEEIAMSANGNPSPYLHPRKHSRHTSLSNPHTPIAKNSAHLSSSRHGRDPVTESEEIWEELADDTLSPLISSFHQRRSSARSTPSADRQRLGSRDGAAADSPTESTALLARTGTGRSYRDRRRRRSAPHLEGLGRSQTQDRRRSSVQQDALGGWWKMRWWKKGRDDGDGRGEEG